MPERVADDAEVAGVRIAVLDPRTILLVLAASTARDEAGAQLTSLAAQRGFSLRRAAPGRWFIVASTSEAAAPIDDLKRMLGGSASVLDQSDGQVAIAVKGAQVRATLAKGIAVDLHPECFRVDEATSTLIGHIPAHLARTGADDFEVLVPRSYAASLLDSLGEMAAEFGCEAQPAAIA
jgi:sarcosine oxidase subunit gamma